MSPTASKDSPQQATTAGPLFTREEPLQKLESFCKTLDSRFMQAGLTPEQSQDVWRLGVTAECVRCGIRVYGEELYALSQPPSEQYANAKLGRLRRGDCAREGCNSYSCRLTFYPYAELDWRALVAELEGGANEASQPGSGQEPAARRALRLLVQSRQTRRVAVGLALIVVLLVARQWHIGGRIPLLREPHKFQVAPDSKRFLTH